MIRTLAIVFLMTVAALLAQPVFVIEGNYNPYSASKSPISTWDGTAFTQANVMVGQSMQAPRPLQSFRRADGRIFVVAIQPFYNNNVFTFEYSGGQFLPLGQTRAGDSYTAAYGVVLSPDCSRAYVLTLTGHLWPIDLSDLFNPVVGNPIAVPGGQKFDIRPQGDRILVTGYNAVVHDVNLLTGTVTTLNLNQPYYQPQIRYSPDGAFAYFGLEDAQHSFVVLNTASYPATLAKIEPGPGGSFGMADVAFHPTLKRAYFMSWPSGGSATSVLYVIDTNTHTAIGFTPVLPGNLAHYQLVMEPDATRMWLVGATNDTKFYGIPVDPAGVPQMATLSVNVPAQTTAVFGMAVPQPAVGATPSFLASLGTRSGTQGARQWPLRVRNTGPVAVFGTQVSQVLLTQTAGPACSPSVVTPMPMAYGNIAPGATVTNNVTINFTGCANTVRFKMQAAVGTAANSQMLTVANNQPM